MTTEPARVRVLRLSVILAVVFNVLALVVLLRTTPIGFTVFMFVGQPLFLAALVLLVSAVLAELKARKIF